jgi:hypothetical protein
VSVRLTPTGDTAVEVFHGELHTKIPPPGALATAADGASAHGTILASFDTKTFPVNLKGFPVQGNIAIELVPGGTRIPVSLELPKVFGGVTGDAELQTTEADGLKLNSLHIEAPLIPIGPLFIQDLVIDYQRGSEDKWTGGAILILPPPADRRAWRACDVLRGHRPPGLTRHRTRGWRPRRDPLRSRLRALRPPRDRGADRARRCAAATHKNRDVPGPGAAASRPGHRSAGHASQDHAAHPLAERTARGAVPRPR